MSAATSRASVPGRTAALRPSARGCGGSVLEPTLVDVLDASALLAFLQGEDGAGIVEQALIAGACCGAANWSEVAQKVLASGHNWEVAATLLATYGLDIEPVTREAESAACGSGRPAAPASSASGYAWRWALAWAAVADRSPYSAYLGDVPGSFLEVVIIR